MATSVGSTDRVLSTCEEDSPVPKIFEPVEMYDQSQASFVAPHVAPHASDQRLNEVSKLVSETSLTQSPEFNQELSRDLHGPDGATSSIIRPVIASSFSLNSDIPYIHIAEFSNSELTAISSSNQKPLNSSVNRNNDLALNARSALCEPRGIKADAEEVFEGMSEEQVKNLNIMANYSGMQRYEFSLKLLDVLFTEDEQAHDAINGGGILRNLDARRVYRLKCE